MDLRRLAYFVAVAEELHFGRAAQRLHMASSPLSRAIKHLERDVGADLFIRDRHHVALTAAGETLLAEARAVFGTVERAAAAARAAGRGEASNARRTLAVGVYNEGLGELNVSAADAFTERYPDVDLVFRQLRYTEIGRALADRLVDVVVGTEGACRQPGGEFVPVFRDRMVISLPAHHHLAEAPAVTLADLSNETFLAAHHTPAEVRAPYVLATSRPPRALRINRAVSPRSPLDFVRHVANGSGIAATNVTCARFFPHRHVRYVPIVDAATVAVGVTVPARSTRVHQAFRDAVIAAAAETGYAEAAPGTVAAQSTIARKAGTPSS